MLLLLALAVQIQFIEVAPEVKLEVIDWGGAGRPLVLLAGGGDTAHVYDQFAPKLTNEFHVYGITRRGFGASSKPKTGYKADELADDVLKVLNALQLKQPILAGHSVAGEELTSLGARHGNRLAALIYLDAAWDRTYTPPPDNKRSGSFDKVGIPSQPKPDPNHFDPQKELGAGVKKPDYKNIKVPALALYGAPRTWQELMPGAPAITDPEKQAAAETVVKSFARTRQHMVDQFQSEVPNGQAIEIQGAGHYLFQTHEAEVLREIRAFVQSAKWN